MGCKDSIKASLPVRIVKTPSIGITQSPNGCVPVNFNLAGSLLNNDTASIAWKWYFSDSRTADGKVINQMPFSSAGLFNTRLVAVNSHGCKDTADTQVEVFPLPVVVADADKIICQGRGKAITATGAASYTWSPAIGLSCTTCPTPIAMPALATTYRVTGKTLHGCIARDSIVVSVKYPFNLEHSRGDTLCVGEATELRASGAASYAWTPSAGLSNTSKPIVSARPNITCWWVQTN